MFFFFFFHFLWKGFQRNQNFEFPGGTHIISLNKVVTRYFDMFRDRALQLWDYELKCKCMLEVMFWLTIWQPRRHPMVAANYCKTILKTLCMHPAHPLLPDGWHLRGIMPFIIILWTLIDALFDQRRYPGWIRVSRCQKCKISLIRNASSVFIPSHWL